jgi:hypothetical protein
VKRGCDLLDGIYPKNSRRLSGRLRGDSAIRQARSYSWSVTDPESGRLVSRLRGGAGTAKSPEAAYRPAWFDANAKSQPPLL